MTADMAHNAARGLSRREAQRRLAQEGFNELPRADRRTPWRIALEVLREPMLALLLGGGAVYLLIGDLQDALILLLFAMLSVVIAVAQEARTERVLEALRDLTSPRALVVRDGEQMRIAGREVVRGDLLVLAEGDRIAADALLDCCDDLQADESLLTGESVPVRKRARSAALDHTPRPGGDDLPMVYSGALVVRGSGLAEVVATGARSEIGKIGQSLRDVPTETSPLRTQTRQVVRLFALVGGAISLLAVLLYGLLRGSWLEAVLAGIALGMSMLPEEFPVVLTVFLAMGAWRISRARVLTRRSAAIESLGAATVLCTDKTGTLTLNHMRIAELRSYRESRFDVCTIGTGALSTECGELLHCGVLASATDPFDPMEKAFHALHQATDAEHAVLLRRYGLRPDLLAVTQVWRRESESDVCVASKGATEAIVDLCRLPTDQRRAVQAAADAMAERGLRVLGVAQARFAGGELPDDPHAYALEFKGLVGLADPLRESVPAAVRECRSAGIRVVMITGDYPATAVAIARQAGLDTAEVLTGEELQQLGDAELARRVRTVTVFARIMPAQKLRIVKALKANDETVAMTGDGVNDAPSLKAAHIGIAMGGRGTDVAREAASIVLLDDDFGSIVKAVGLGRRIYDNLRKAMSFIFAVHVPIAGLALLPLTTGLPIVLGPIHIAFLEMVIDPVCSLVFEAEVAERDVMRRPPRPRDESLFSNRLMLWGVVQGLFGFALVAATYLLALRGGMPDDDVRALAFFTLVTVIVALIFVNRSFSASLLAAFRRPNAALKFVLAAVVGILSLTLFWPAASRLFHFGALHAHDLAFACGAGVFVLVTLDLVKWAWQQPFRAARRAD
jgi:P-type Ca2+ transporter type 2C